MKNLYLFSYQPKAWILIRTWLNESRAWTLSITKPKNRIQGTVKIYVTSANPDQNFQNWYDLCITSVADPWCFTRIRIFPFRIPDPWSKRFRIRIFNPKKLSEIWPGCLSRILIFYQSRNNPDLQLYLHCSRYWCSTWGTACCMYISRTMNCLANGGSSLKKRIRKYQSTDYPYRLY